MRVLVLAQYFPPDMGGGATRAYNMAKGLTLNGCEVTVIAAFPHYPTGKIPRVYRWKPLLLETLDGFRVIRTFVPPLASQGLWKRIFLFFSFMISSIFAIFLVGKYDIVWAANPNVLSAFPSLFYAAIRQKQAALNVDDLWPEDLCITGLVRENSLKSKVMSFIAKLAYSMMHLVTPISPGHVNILQKKYSVGNKKIHVVKAGVDLSKFEGIRIAPHPSKKHFKICYSGAFSVAYNFDQVLLAAKSIATVSGIEFILQGGGELSEYVKYRAKRLALKNVYVIDKIVSREEVAKFLCEADALILPLKGFRAPYLGISSKLYEYQAAGRPIICCAEGQPSEYVKKTRSGIVVKPGDYRSLATAILNLRNKPEFSKNLGKNGRRHVQEHLSCQKIGLEMKNVLCLHRH